MKIILSFALLVLTPLFASAAPQNIVDTAVANGSFKTLTSLLQEAGLVDTLKGSGPFTVFAPTDAAFAKIPAAKLAELKADKAKLAEVLKYHVVSGKVDAKAVQKLDSAESISGETIEIDSAYGVKVNDAKVVTADVMASNGIIHVIDTVLMP
jgi:uncharacterized surface protein with fasciclin (FAS1) repeats